MEPALDVVCPVCDADVGEPCDEYLTHAERRDEVGDPGPLAVADLDGDGVASWRDLDDPAHWL